MEIAISLKDVIWRLDHPDEEPKHLNLLQIMWIDVFTGIFREEIQKEEKDEQTGCN